MHVAHLITRLIVGGAQENTIATVLGLREKPRVRVELIAGPTTGPEGTLEPVVRAIPDLFTLVPELVRPVSPFKDLRAFRKLTHHFRRTLPDIVHTHSGKAGILGRLAARRAGVPLIVHSIHGPSFGPFQGNAANLLFETAERLAGRCTHHFVTVADAMSRQYLAAGIGRPDQYTRVFSGFDLEPFLNAGDDPELRRRLDLKPDDFVVGKIARLFKLKGHEDVIAAAPEIIRQIPNVRFLFVGGGQWRDRFEAELNSAGLLEYFRFTGLVPPDEVPRHIGLMNCLVHLSRREGLARALPQALAAGKPVIAYDCDGAREVCLEGETGFLLQPDDRPGLINALVRLAENPSLRASLGDRGGVLARENFGVQHMVDSIHELYLRLRGA